MASHDGARSIHWTYLFPQRLVEQLLVPVGEDGGQEVVLRMTLAKDVEDPQRHRTRAAFGSLAAVRQWLLAAAPMVTSLHVDPSGRHLVFDLDIRENYALLSAPCSCAATGDAVCAACWPIANVALAMVEFQMDRLTGGAVRAPLCVYSGRNGLHLWYDVRQLEERHPLRTRAGQQMFFTVLRDRAHYPPSFFPTLATTYGLPQVLYRLPKFDENVTLWPRGGSGAQGHLVKLPFSLHEKNGRVAYPLAVHGLALPLPTAAVDWGAARAIMHEWLTQPAHSSSSS